MDYYKRVLVVLLTLIVGLTLFGFADANSCLRVFDIGFRMR